MSKFYTEISKYYDYIFPTGEAQLNLIKEVVGKPPKAILDVACGSGGYSKKLLDLGYDVTAIDLDDSMVEKLKGRDKGINARVMNMLDIDKIHKKFDLIFCIGNSLVHLNNDDEIYDFLRKCANNLNSGGHLVLQIVNYDRVLGKNVKSLPLIENEEVDLVFERYYDYMTAINKINFRTILKVDGLTLENNVLLHPIESKKLIELLEKGGFTNIKLYGNFKKDEYDPLNSFPLVVVAEVIHD